MNRVAARSATGTAPRLANTRPQRSRPLPHAPAPGWHNPGSSAAGRWRSPEPGAGIRSRVQKLGDSKVEELGNSICGNQDVARFDIAVHDQVLVRVLHGIAHLAEQAQPLLDGKLLLLAPV